VNENLSSVSSAREPKSLSSLVTDLNEKELMEFVQDFETN